MNRSRTFIYCCLISGFIIAGLGLALMLQSELGMGPWGAFQVSLASRTGLSAGRVTQLVSLVLLLIAWLLGVKPTLACFANMVVVGASFDFFAEIIPACGNISLKFALLLLGILSHSFGISLYLAADLGSGPRESLMLAISERCSISIRVSRIFMDASIFLTTLFLGGPIGVGTAIHTISCGPLIQYFLTFPDRDQKKTRPADRAL